MHHGGVTKETLVEINVVERDVTELDDRTPAAIGVGASTLHAITDTNLMSARPTGRPAPQCPPRIR
jgi:hypothetical protein